MIMRAQTPKGLSWAGRLAVLGTAALLLPLAPSWGQKTEADSNTASVDRPADSSVSNDLVVQRAESRPIRSPSRAKRWVLCSTLPG